MPTSIVRKFSCKTSGLLRASAVIILVGAVAFYTDQAAAVSAAVRSACVSDYFAYCSQYAVGSQALRNCMRAAGPKLSKSCVSALVAAGEVPQVKGDRRLAGAR